MLETTYTIAPRENGTMGDDLTVQSSSALDWVTALGQLGVSIAGAATGSPVSTTSTTIGGATRSTTTIGQFTIDPLIIGLIFLAIVIFLITR